MFIEEDEYLAHYGILRRSGRYPWNSGGEDEYTRNATFMTQVRELEKKGLTQAQIAESWDCSIQEIRSAKSLARSQNRAADIAMATRLKEDRGWSTNAIAKHMGQPESTVRNLLRPGEKDKADILTATANMLREEVAKNKFIDVGKGVESSVNVSATRLSNAVSILREEGYELHAVYVPQVTGTKDTRMKILCPPGTPRTEAFNHRFEIKQPTSSSQNGGRDYDPIHSPMVVNPKRVGVKYANEGGGKADGVIYVRPGEKDLYLGGKSYAQVRVQVGKEHYLKGMAMYRDDLPDGVDLLFNTSKHDTGNKLDALKKLEDDPDLPFGSIVRQITDKPGKGGKPISAMNIVNEEGQWDLWSKTLSTQMLSKQNPLLAKSQLDMTYERRQIEYENIMRLTNPAVRKKMLLDFAGSTDTASIHLKAAAMPGQAVRVILPVPSLKPTEVYAPTFKHGEQVVLVRHPHGGVFEIPQLIVNRRHPEGKKLLGEAKDAIGINPDVASWLSGADFDGDTVLVIPNAAGSGRIKTAPMLDALKGFDPRSSYPKVEGMKVMRNTQNEMGKISNLITDMSIKKAPHSEIARAVKHSMVVIDAEKHELNYRLSENDFGIKELKAKYQRNPVTGSSGASTLISKRKQEIRIPERKERSAKKGGPINKVTGEREYEETGARYWKKGEQGDLKKSKVAAIDLTPDAHTLSSGSRIEFYYAEHSNELKGLANRARLSAVNTPPAKRIPSSAKAYASEVASLNASLTLAKSNAPLERQAQLAANSEIKLKRQYNPTMDKDQLEKVKQKALSNARTRIGADKHKIVISQTEWDAIQAGAISNYKLEEILTHADMDVVRKLATPKDQPLMTAHMRSRARNMAALGYSRDEIAQQLGVSRSTLENSIV